MAFVVTMPKLSPTMEEGTIAKWHKKEGDKVEAGELLVDIATDKATIEYNALDEGYLRKIMVSNGGSAAINQPIALFSERADENIENFHPKGVAVKTEEVGSVRKTEAPSPVEKPKAAATTRAEPSFTPAPPLKNAPFPFPTGTLSDRVPSSPLARKMAKEKGLDLSTVKGSGPSGRVVSRDLDLAQPSQPVTFGRRELPDVPAGSYEEIPLTPMRKVIGQRLQDSKSFIPHFYVRQEINAQPLVELYEQLKQCELKVTYNDFIIRAAALALREHPNVNSGFNSVNQAIVLFKTVDIAVAVSVDGGLITPIIRFADYKNLGEIDVEIKELAKRAKAGKLEPHEYQGGSFTISNLGMFGISEFVGILNPPQSALLAVAGIEDCVRMKGDLPVAGKKMSLTLSADHRVIDGVEGAKFMKTLQYYLERPSILLI